MQHPITTGSLISNPTFVASSSSLVLTNQSSLHILPTSQSANATYLFHPNNSTQQVPSLPQPVAQQAHKTAAFPQVWPNPVRSQHQAPNCAVGASGAPTPHLYPIFQYPGGVHISTPRTAKVINLADIATLSRGMPLGKTAGQSVINFASHSGLPGVSKEEEVEEVNISRKLLDSDANYDKIDRHVSAQLDNHNNSHEGQKKVDSIVAKPLVPHTPSLSPPRNGTQSPLLFDSCENSAETPSRIHASLAAKLAEKMNKPQLVPRLNIGADSETSLTPQPLHPISTTEDRSHGETGKSNTDLKDKKVRCETGRTITGDNAIIIDDDLTPPISPLKPPSPHSREVSEYGETCNLHQHFGRTNIELECEKSAQIRTPILVLKPVENTPLGQPKRRANTRLAARKSKSGLRQPVLEERVSAPKKVISRMKGTEFTSEDSDEADFKPEKSKTPKKTAPPQLPAVQVCYVHVFLLQLNP